MTATYRVVNGNQCDGNPVYQNEKGFRTEGVWTGLTPEKIEIGVCAKLQHASSGSQQHTVSNESILPESLSHYSLEYS
jgi:hypothetical protein